MDIDFKGSSLNLEDYCILATEATQDQGANSFLLCSSAASFPLVSVELY